MNEEVPDGIKTIARLSGIGVGEILPQLRGVLCTPEKIGTFNRVVEETIREKSEFLSDIELALAAMNAAGEAILGQNRPNDPRTTEGFLEKMVDTGLMRRVRH